MSPLQAIKAGRVPVAGCAEAGDEKRDACLPWRTKPADEDD